MLNLKHKKLLILGGIDLSCEIIKEAKKHGIYTVVTDYLEDSPGKKIADQSFMISTTDVDEVVELIKREHIDGILTGFVDMLLPSYQEICEKSGLHCYATKEQIKITTDKFKFKSLCKKFEIPVVSEYEVQASLINNQSEDILFPVIIKPADNSGGRGIFICNNFSELKVNYEKSLLFSPTKRVIVERYMDCEEVTIFYIIKDGEIYLSAMGDRHTKHRKGEVIPLPVAYTFSSKYLRQYQKNLNAKVIEMFKSIGIANGMIFIQSFVENDDFIFYEMGYRLTGSLEYKIMSEINNINPLEMMIHYAITGKMTEGSIEEKVNPDFSRFGFNITFLADAGEIGQIVGVNEVLSIPGIIDVVKSYDIGDIVPSSAKGTLKQVVIRVFGTAETKVELSKIMDEVHNKIKVYSPDGKNMLLETFDTKELF